MHGHREQLYRDQSLYYGIVSDPLRGHEYMSLLCFLWLIDFSLSHER